MVLGVARHRREIGIDLRPLQVGQTTLMLAAILDYEWFSCKLLLKGVQIIINWTISYMQLRYLMTIYFRYMTAMLEIWRPYWNLAEVHLKAIIKCDISNMGKTRMLMSNIVS